MDVPSIRTKTKIGTKNEKTGCLYCSFYNFLEVHYQFQNPKNNNKKKSRFHIHARTKIQWYFRLRGKNVFAFTYSENLPLP